ncbi:MAG: hypothetical protein ACR2QS_03915 [Woeseiaceae bacterium]
MMDVLYVLAIWAHIFVVAFWIGAMFFADPESTRFFSRQVERIGGVGWYAHAVLWTTGAFMLYYRGETLSNLFSVEFISSGFGMLAWLKMLFVMSLVGLQVYVGHKPSNLSYAYVLLGFFTIGVSTILARADTLGLMH